MARASLSEGAQGIPSHYTEDAVATREAIAVDSQAVQNLSDIRVSQLNDLRRQLNVVDHEHESSSSSSVGFSMS